MDHQKAYIAAKLNIDPKKLLLGSEAIFNIYDYITGEENELTRETENALIDANIRVYSVYELGEQDV